MTETFKKANNIMKIIANASACMVAYDKLSSADFWVKKDGFERIKKETDSQFWHDVFNESQCLYTECSCCLQKCAEGHPFRSALHPFIPQGCADRNT